VGDHSNLTDYLHFDLDGGKLALVVDPDGTGANTQTQTIVLQNYTSTDALALDLGLNAGASDADILNKMVQHGRLQTDA
jgi:hypothetical protein